MPDHRSRRRLVAASLAAALMPLNSTMIAVALPEITDDLGQDPAVVAQSLVTSYLVAAIVLQSPAGKIGDRIGHARMVAIGQVLIGVGAVVGYLAPSLLALTGARVLMAAGGAVLVPAAVALLRHGLPPDRRGRAFGAFGAVMAMAAAMGPLVGGELVHAFGWRSVFIANVPVLALSVALVASAGHLDPVSTTGTRPRFDWLGSGLLAAALTSIVVGLRPGGHQEVPLLVVGVALAAPFVIWERRVTDPVVAFSLFRSVPFTAGTLLIALQNLVMYALLFEVPIMAVALLDLSPRQIGQLLVSMTLAMVLVSPISGRLVDHVGARVMAVAGSVVAIAAIVAATTIEVSSPAHLAVPLALLGVGLGLTTPSAQSASISGAPADAVGMAAGVSSTMRYLGGLVGVAVMSLLLDVDGTRGAIVHEHRTLMIVFAGVLLLGLACAAMLPARIPQSSPAAPAEQLG